MKSKFLKFFAALMIAGICFCAVSCSSGTDTHGFLLNETEITVLTNEESKQLKVLKDNVEYHGAIRWIPQDAMIVSVYQGYVKGVGVGESAVQAEIVTDSGTVKLSCKVTVKQSVTAEIYDVTVFSGLGDIDVTLASGLYTNGATVTIQSVTKANGNTVDVLKQVNGRYYLENGTDQPLSADRYYVTYRLSLDGVTKDFVREINVKPADRYENIFVLDAVDGTEKMFGMAANLEFLTGLHRSDENPGQYVTYTDDGNTGYDEDNGINQTRGEMLDSLRSEGYDGFLNENYAGYDTVYRMYCKKGNATSQPLPFFYLNLHDTANPLWTNLNADSLPEQLYLSVWMRVWHRADSSEEYKLLPAGDEWCYLYKSMNDGETQIGDGAGIMKTGGTWAHCRFDLSKIIVQAQGADHIAVGMGVWCNAENNYGKGEFLFELYSVELDIPNTLSSKDGGDLDLKLYGEYSGVFDGYTFEVKNAQGQVVVSGDNTNTRVSLTQGESYTVEYTLKKGEKTLPNKYVRKIEGNA